MTKNVGNTDQNVRLVGGLLLLSVVLVGAGDWRWLGLIGLPLLLSAIFRVCPLYTALKINTYPKETEHV